MSQVNVDSANTTAIQYESYGPSPWKLVQTGNNGNIFAQTLTVVESTGGAVFRFHGTNVQVYGTITPPTDPGATVTSSYTIDGAAAGSFSSSTVPAALVNEADGQLFFDSGTISDGDHTLVINVTLASAAEPYQIDYIKYTATPPTSSSSTSGTATGSGSASPSATSGTSGSSHTNVGPIAGGVVGGVLGVALVAGIGLFLFFRYFRHRITLSGRKRGGRDMVEDLVENGKPGSDTDPSSTGPLMSDLSASTPWRSGTPTYGGGVPPVPYAASSTVGPEDSASQVAGRIYAAEMAQASGSSCNHGPSLLAGHVLGSGMDSKQPIPPSVPEEPEVEAVQHQDSGIRFRSGDIPPVLPVVPVMPEPVDHIDELPPDYTPPPS
ncbi:hypothetical protein BN946_scf185015.g82 [Trametes cinnabarina]|uniref:Mid2 domain-containing protein n=1 Tax=Pycnoporus cinnabarinus TaxID=5643 RepID=A0A060SNG0_PYCCI|nr:hypothetical protein BN946_scf185015.g82 [Trametes cinnabarina]